jgi:hypothetical protein
MQQPTNRFVCIDIPNDERHFGVAFRFRHEIVLPVHTDLLDLHGFSDVSIW